MYHATSKFLLAGLPQDVVKTIEAVEPLERFTHKFETADRLPSEIAADVTAVIFTGDTSAVKAARAARKSEKTLLIFVSSAPDELAEDDIMALADVWPETLTETVTRYYFTRLIRMLKAKKDAWLTELYLDQTIDTMPDLIWYKDKRGAHLKVNDAFCHIVGKTKDDIRGRGHCYIWGLTPEQYEQGEYVCMETEIEVMDKGVTCVFDEHVMGPDGIIQLQTYKTPLRDEDGTVMGTVGIARDVTKLKKYEAELIHAARIDDLTGLFNRRYFYEYIHQNRGAKPVTIARTDLSYFKQLNDTYGAKKGDDALIAMADILREAYPEATICRYGGGEFLLANIGSDDVSLMREKFPFVIEKIKSYCEKDALPILLSATMGITSTTDANISPDKLVRQSDLALYYTRNLGDGHCCVFNEIISE